MSKRKAFNPTEWPRAARYTYSCAARKGNVICIAGMIGNDMVTGDITAPGDIVGQTRQAYENIKTALEAAGANFDDVIETIEFITPEALANYKGTAAIRREYFGDKGFPAATGIVAPRLLHPEAMIEIRVMAVVD